MDSTHEAGSSLSQTGFEGCEVVRVGGVWSRRSSALRALGAIRPQTPSFPVSLPAGAYRGGGKGNGNQAA